VLVKYFVQYLNKLLTCLLTYSMSFVPQVLMQKKIFNVIFSALPEWKALIRTTAKYKMRIIRPSSLLLTCQFTSLAVGAITAPTISIHRPNSCTTTTLSRKKIKMHLHQHLSCGLLAGFYVYITQFNRKCSTELHKMTLRPRLYVLAPCSRPHF